MLFRSFAFAIDGPIFPTPSWKIVLEVYDQAKLQGTFERAIEKLNHFSVLHGKGKLNLENTTAGSRTFYSIKSADAGLEVHYTYANGYLVAAPSRALLEQSLTNREAGNTLGVPIAAGVLYPVFGLLLSPMIASAAMTFSSVSVISNALRLRRADL